MLALVVMVGARTGLPLALLMQREEVEGQAASEPQLLPVMIWVWISLRLLERFRSLHQRQVHQLPAVAEQQVLAKPAGLLGLQGGQPAPGYD